MFRLYSFFLRYFFFFFFFAILQKWQTSSETYGLPAEAGVGAKHSPLNCCYVLIFLLFFIFFTFLFIFFFNYLFFIISLEATKPSQTKQTTIQK